MLVMTGTYTGNGGTLGVTGVGFLPDLVIVKDLNFTDGAQFKTTEMGSNNSLPIRGDGGFNTDRIVSLDSDGFTLSTATTTNTSGRTYLYIAIRDDGGGEFTTGSYVGDATDGLAVTGVGFQPDYVLIKANSGIVGASKYQGQTDSSMQFGGGDRTDLIISLDSDGFTVNNGSSSGGNLVNISAATHYYFAFKEVAGKVSVFSYTGNNTDNRDITTPGFQPDFVLIKGNTGANPNFRLTSNSGDASQAWDSAVFANAIQSFISTGFQIGTAGEVNSNTVTYYALAIKNSPNTAGGTILRGILGSGFIPFAR